MNRMTPDELADDDAKYVALEHEMATADLAAEGESAERQDAEPYDAQHGAGQPQFIPYQEPELPEIMADPINHFDARMARVEEHAAISQMAAAARAADIEGREEFSDYNEMVEHLHRVAIEEGERQGGRRLTEPERVAFIKAATMGAMAQAAQHGVSAVQYVREIARDTGFAFAEPFGKTEFKRLVDSYNKASLSGDTKTADKIWARYERESRRADRR